MLDPFPSPPLRVIAAVALIASLSIGQISAINAAEPIQAQPQIGNEEDDPRLVPSPWEISPSSKERPFRRTPTGPEVVYDLGSLGWPKGVVGRDEGVSASVGGYSVWAFGDTGGPGAMKFVSNSAAVNVPGFLPTIEPLDSSGFPASPMIQLTNEEIWFTATTPNSRVFVWPTGVIAPRSPNPALVYWIAGRDQNHGQYIPGSSTGGIAQIAPGATTGTRRTTVFDKNDCAWSSPVIDQAGGYIYLYAHSDSDDPAAYDRTRCPNAEDFAPLRWMVSRVPVGQEATRSAYRFWNGTNWATNASSSTQVLTAFGPDIEWDQGRGEYVAIGGIANDTSWATAPAPEGPWTDRGSFVIPRPSNDPNTFGNYSWRMHGEHAGADGGIQLVTYAHTNPQQTGSIEMMAVDSRADSLDRRDRYIDRLYQELLGRSVSTSERHYWVTNLENANFTLPFVTDYLSRSREGRANTVRRAYREVFGREAEPGGTSYWAEEIAAPGMGHSNLTSWLASSAEMKQLYPTSRSYVDAIYRISLGRNADSGGRDYWAGQIDKGMSRPSYVLAMMRSVEGGERQTDLAYRDLLNRPAPIPAKRTISQSLRDAVTIRVAVAASPIAIGLD